MKKTRKKEKSRETHYNEEKYYGHGLKERNKSQNAMENKIKKNVT